MHPSPAALIAHFDGETGAGSRRIAKHLSKCDTCGGEMRRIQRERAELAAGVAMAEIDDRPGLAAVLSAIAQWRSNAAGAAELKRRLRSQIKWHFGSSALSVVERSDMPAEELLGKTSELLDVFLGHAAAQAVRDDVLSGLECTSGEARR